MLYEMCRMQRGRLIDVRHNFSKVISMDAP